ncbi:MAG: hypothetical protein HW390_86 [Candidatus Brocadiaceae bacterium]|nr:hypothetical protein [Candidatus Brocadiaceae bacterium]
MMEEVQKLIGKAEHAIKVAESLMNGGYPSDAASKIYYAVRGGLNDGLRNTGQRYPGKSAFY